MTAHQKQINAFLEMCEHYILATKSVEELDAIGHEIAAIKAELKVSKNDLVDTTRIYLRHKKTMASQLGP